MAELKGYHAHVYYDAATKPIAILPGYSEGLLPTTR